MTLSVYREAARPTILIFESYGKWRVICAQHQKHWLEGYFRPRIFKSEDRARESGDKHLAEVKHG